MEAGLVGYLDGSIMAPSVNADLKEKNEWLQYNSCIIGTLGYIVDDSLAQELTPTMLASEAWAIVKKRTSQSGIIAKLNSMQAAITTKFSKAKEMNTTIGELCDHLAAVSSPVLPLHRMSGSLF